MATPGWLASLMGVCARRRQETVPADETPFWEEQPVAKSAGEGAEEAAGQEEEKPDTLGYEQAMHLKDEGKEKFARGDTKEAMDSWLHALDALCAPPPASGFMAETKRAPLTDLFNDPKVQELRTSLLLNIAIAHKKLKQWRHAVSYCDEVLLDSPGHVKALYTKADALGELCDWKDAEDAAAKLEATGDEGRKLAAQKRDEWRRRRKADAGRQKKMWSAALTEAKETKEVAKEPPVETPVTSSEGKENEKPKQAAKSEVLEKWTPPKVESMSVFDLRRKEISWDENEDFSDKIWRDGLGRKEATFYQSRALPLTLLAGASLADLEFQSDYVVHCILDGNIAPFSQPHDWKAFLQRVPSIRSLTIIYIDIGAVGEPGKDHPPSMPYGTLLKPTEEGRIGDRVARAARFLGTYKEFRDHCRDLPGLVDPHLALWADVPMYGFNNDDFGVRLEAYEALAAMGVPSLFTLDGEIVEPGGPVFSPKPDEQGCATMGVLRVGLAAKMGCSWHWNRFVVPLDRGEQGILAAHAMIAVAKPAKSSGLNGPALLNAVKKRLKQRGIELKPFKLPKALRDDGGELRKQQWEAFCRKLKAEGRPVGPQCSPEERNRQAMEFYQFCGMSDAMPPC
eukprot:TRINITY_DN54352_c0_g1_i1.p1 TRINITY_DN54352_c0_g1~~TRINITY_DN54352_c0_g1_i1.p1  ORF type:complete len:651 (-),score=114.87 TRINITY_DN54352_c0_g1_i1:133-2004(-)